MNIVIVTDSFLNSDRIPELFLPQEIAELSARTPASSMRQTLLGRTALKYAALPTSPVDIVASYNALGQPVIEGQDLYCSIGHSYNAAVGAVSKAPIGVDIEKVRSHDPRLLSYIASKREIALFIDTNPDLLVTKIWVLKESVAKALGIGIKYPFIDIVIQKSDSGFVMKAGGVVWQASLLEYNNYILAYAFPASAAPRETINVQYLK